MLIELLVAGVGVFGAAQDTDTILSVGNATRLDVESMGGEVVIEAWNRDDVSIQADHSRRTEVEIRRSGNTIYVEADGQFTPGIVDYRIQVPAGLDVSVEGWQTDISVTGMNGDVDTETFQGSITIIGGRGTVVAETVNGGITVEGAEGEVRAEGVSGSIRIIDTTAEIRAETVGGSVTLENVISSDVEVGTVGGRIRYSGDIDPNGEYYFGTHGGRVVLELPATASAEFHLSTLSGGVNIDHPGAQGDVRRGRRSRVVLGSGGGIVEVETFSGSVTIREPSE